MATLTTTMTGACAGGSHLHMSLTGAKTASIRLDAEDLKSEITEDDLTAFVKVLCRLCKSGKTMTQAKAALQAGITVIA